MKNRFISGIIIIVLGQLIAIGPQTIFPVCGVGELKQEVTESSSHKDMDRNDHGEADGDKGSSAMDSPMKCSWTARAEIGVGGVIAIVGLLLIFTASSQIRFGLNLAVGFMGLLSFLLPSVFIGVCGSDRMGCRSLTLPVLSILSGSVMAVSIFNGIYLYKIHKGERKAYES